MVVDNIYKYIIKNLSFLPEIFSIYKWNIRQLNIKKYKNYSVFFYISEKDSKVIVLAITNPAQYARYNKLF